MFEKISSFAEEHVLNIEFELDCIGALKIIMTRDNYEIFKRISGSELRWLWDCDEAILIDLEIMLKEIDKNYDKPVLAPKKRKED